MKKIEWTKRNILKTAYWSVFALMFVIAIVVFQQKGLWFEDYFGSEFYKLEAETDTQKVFVSKDSVVTLTGSFPEMEEVYVEVKTDDSEAILWTLTQGGENKLTAANAEVTYTGTYRITDLSCDFYFDDWDAYMDKWTADYSGSATSISRRYASEGAIEGFIRMAYGQRDNFGRYSIPEFIPWIIFVVMAYVIGFHAEVLFEWRKMWEFDYRNADQLEASDWYYISSYIGAAVIWILSFFIYLYIIGVVR